jgi:hypothetical protein
VCPGWSSQRSEGFTSLRKPSARRGIIGCPVMPTSIDMTGHLPSACAVTRPWNGPADARRCRLPPAPCAPCQ